MKSCSILLVEDNEDDVYFVSQAIVRSGIEMPLEIARDGQAAVDYLATTFEARFQGTASTPCLVLLDLILPRRSGLEVLKWIRQESQWKAIIVLVLTSSTSDSDMKTAYQLGANAYLIKPSDATKLRELFQLVKGFWMEWNQVPPETCGRKEKSGMDK